MKTPWWITVYPHGFFAAFVTTVPPLRASESLFYVIFTMHTLTCQILSCLLSGFRVLYNTVTRYGYLPSLHTIALKTLICTHIPWQNSFFTSSGEQRGCCRTISQDISLIYKRIDFNFPAIRSRAWGPHAHARYAQAKTPTHSVTAGYVQHITDMQLASFSTSKIPPLCLSHAGTWWQSCEQG